MADEIKAERRNISQPVDWWEAFERQAKECGYSNLSEWLGDCAKASLSEKEASKLSPRREFKRPKKKNSDG